jgi:hypothetical protein
MQLSGTCQQNVIYITVPIDYSFRELCALGYGPSDDGDPVLKGLTRVGILSATHGRRRLFATIGISLAITTLNCTPALPAMAAPASPARQHQPAASTLGDKAAHPARPATAKPSTAQIALQALQRSELAASRQAAATHQAVVVSAATNTGTLLTANPDGSFTLTETSEPARVLQHGTWVPINPDLVPGANGTWHTVATTSGVTFSGGGTAPMATLASGSGSLSFTFPRALPTPSVSGPVATYRSVLPGIDLQLTANASGFSELLIVHNKAAAANPALRTLKLGMTAQGLTVTSTPDGGAQATARSGATVFHTDTASMWDSSHIATPGAATANGARPATAGSAAGAASAPMGRMAQVGVRVSGTAETLVPSTSLLTSAKTVYPVYIDPAWSGPQTAMDWARISSNGWNIYNSGSTSSSDMARSGFDWSGWGGGGGNEIARTYYQMNTQGLEYAHVTAATLLVTDTFSSYSAATSASVYATGSVPSWNSTGLTWANQPYNPSDSSTYTLEDSESTYESGSSATPNPINFNVLQAMQTAASHVHPSMTFVLRSDDECTSGCPTTNISGWGAVPDSALDWKQYANQGGATLTVTYYTTPALGGSNGDGAPTLTPVVTGADAGYTTSTTPTLKITCGDNSVVTPNIQTVENFYQVYNYSNGTVGSQVGSDLTNSQWSNPGGPVTTPTLSPGTYAWRARCKNYGLTGGTSDSLGTDQYWSAWTAYQPFTVDNTDPPTPTVSSPQFPAGMEGGAYDDAGTFTFNNDHSDTLGGVKGYLYSLDNDLSSTTFSGIPPQLSGTAITPGQIYWAPASTDPNGYATVSFAPGKSGPHRLYVLAVDQAGNVSATENTYQFWAGFTTPTILNADQLYYGYTAADGTTVPAATYNATGGGTGQLYEQPDDWNLHWYNGKQIAMENGTGTVNKGDGMTVSFDVPADGYYDLGADLTKAQDYGIFTITLDASSATPVTLYTGFDGYASPATTQYLDLGVPPDPSSTTGSSLLLKKGLHTLTFTTTSQNASSTGYLLGFDALRIAPMAPACDITSISNCYDDTAITAKADIDNFGTTLPNTAPADGADGSGDTYPAEQLTAAGWSPGASITADGAPMTLPAYGTGLPDNIVSGGQAIDLVDPSSGNTLAPNTGNAVVFLASATNGPVTGASGTITYTGSCYNSTTQSFTLSTVPDWATGPASAASISLPDRNTPTTWESSGIASRIYAISVPLKCATIPVASIQLPEVSNGVKNTEAALHIFALGVRPSSFTSSADNQYWAASYAAAEDSHDGSLPQTTVRIPATVSLAGTSLRIHLSNALGTAPVTFNAVTVAAQSSGAQPIASTMNQVKFGGNASVTIPAGGDATSDPVGLATSQQETLLVSIWTSATIPDTVGHAGAKATSWTTSTTADEAGDTTGTPFTATTDDFLHWLSGIDVTSSGNTDGAVGFYGDQSVNSDSSGDAPNRFTDDVTSDIAASNSGTVPYGVLDLGTNSWTATNNLIPVLSTTAQISAANPVDRNILENTNVRTILISTGTADIIYDVGTKGDSIATAETDVENKLTVLVKEIQSYYADNITNNPAGLITVYVATIPPSSQFTSAEETVREQVNEAICGTSGTNGGCDTTGNTGADLNGVTNGFVDFAGAVSGGNDLTPAVAPGNLYNGNPDNAYYAAEATAYNNAAVAVTTGATSSPSGVLGVQPDLLVGS